MLQAKYLTAVYKAQQACLEAYEMTVKMQEALTAFLEPKGFTCEVGDDFSDNNPGNSPGLHVFGPKGTDKFYADDMQYSHYGELLHPELEDILEEFMSVEK